MSVRGRSSYSGTADPILGPLILFWDVIAAIGSVKRLAEAGSRFTPREASRGRSNFQQPRQVDQVADPQLGFAVENLFEPSMPDSQRAFEVAFVALPGIAGAAHQLQRSLHVLVHGGAL